MDVELMKQEFEDRINKQMEDIERLNSIIEAKQNDIADCLQVLESLSRIGGSK